MRRPSPSGLASLVAVGGAVLFVFVQLEPGLLFRDTTPAGGDMGAHVWGPAYLRDHLLGDGRLAGWAPDWYAGFPYLTFYFPLPSLLIALVDLVLPYGVAFKLLSVSGLLSLPLAAWAFGALAGLRFPGPPCLGIATLPFLFMTRLFDNELFNLQGGNIASTLAGEFAFSMSLSLALVFLGLVAGGLDSSRRRALAAGLLALTLLCHVIPTMFAVVGAGVATLMRPAKRRFGHILVVAVVGGLLTAFWALPFLVRQPYMNDMGWEKVIRYRQFLMAPGWWLLALAATGAVVSAVLRLRPGMVLSATAALCALAFCLLPEARLYNARLLPFWYLCLFLLAGLAVAEAGRGLGSLAATWGRPERSLGTAFAVAVLTPLAMLALVLYYVARPLGVLPSWAQAGNVEASFLPGWVQWNYSGYEAKDSYPEYRALVSTMEDLGRRQGCGRAFWEYEEALDVLATPMALMLLPYWTDGCIGSMEGLYFESSATVPYHFLAQSELSLAPSRAQRKLHYRGLDVARGVEHLRLLGARYYMALSPEAQAQARAHPDLRLLATSGPWQVAHKGAIKERTWEVYEVKGSELVSALAHEPVVMAGGASGASSWLEAAEDWYNDPSRLDVPLAADGPEEWQRAPRLARELPRRPLPPVQVSRVRSDDDSISFDVDRPGTPVLVKVSYFPSWRASGARGPWRVTPNLMVVVPTDTHVELRYTTTPPEIVGWGLTLAGVALLVVMVRRRTPAGPSPDELTPDAAASFSPPERQEPDVVSVT